MTQYFNPSTLGLIPSRSACTLQSIFDKAAAENEVYSFYNWAYAPYPPMDIGKKSAAAAASEVEMVPIGPLTGVALRRQATKKREEKRRLRDRSCDWIQCYLQGVPFPRRPGFRLGWLRFGEFPRLQLVGRYFSYLLPKQGGGTSQIEVNKTQSTRTWDALYRYGFCESRKGS